MCDLARPSALVLFYISAIVSPWDLFLVKSLVATLETSWSEVFIVGAFIKEDLFTQFYCLGCFYSSTISAAPNDPWLSGPASSEDSQRSL